MFEGSHHWEGQAVDGVSCVSGERRSEGRLTSGVYRVSSRHQHCLLFP